MIQIFELCILLLMYCNMRKLLPTPLTPYLILKWNMCVRVFSFFWHFVKFLFCLVYKFSTTKDSELKVKLCIMGLRILQPRQLLQEFIIWKLKLNSKIKSEFLNNEITDPEMNMHWEDIIQCNCSNKFNYLQK